MMSLKGGERSGRSNAKDSQQRWKVHLLTMAVAGAGLSSMIANSYGAILQKANNTTPMNQAASWVQNAAPTSADTIVFDNTVQAPNTNETLGGALSVTGVQVIDPAGPISITDTNALSIGTGGIDMSLASQNLSLALPVTLTAAQTWIVGSGVTLTDSGSIDTTGGTLSVSGAGNATLSGPITGTNGLTLVGSGTVTLSGSESYSGATTINGGVLSLSGGSINSSSALVMGGGTLLANGSTASFASATFNAGLSVIDGGGGTVNLNNSTFTRNTGASVRFMPGSTYNVPSLTVISGGLSQGTSYYATYGLTDVATNQGGAVVGGDSVGNFWLVGTPSSGAQRFNGSGQNRLDVGTVSGLFRSNTENPTINVLRFNSPQGGYQVGRDGNNGPVFVVRNTNVVNFNEILVTPNVGAEDVFITDDATINNTGPRTNGDLTLWQNNTQGFLVFNVGIGSTGTGVVTKAGLGTVIFNGTDSYAGNTIAAEGTLELANLTALSSSSNAGLVMSGGNVLSLINDQLTTNGQFTGTSKNVVLNGGAGAIAAVAGDSFGISGVISGAGGVNIGLGSVDSMATPGQTVVVHKTVTGNGTVVFAGANTYTGVTDVKFGTLQVSNTTGSGTGTGNVVVESGATLGGGGTIAGNVKVIGFIAPGDAVSLNPLVAAPNTGTLTIGGKLTLASGAIINYEPGDVISAAGVSIADSLAHINIFTPGLTIPYFNGGTFTVINDVGASATTMAALLSKFTTASILNANPATSGYSYTFQTSGTILSLKIVSPVIVSEWVGSDGNWNTTEEGNWNAVLTSPVRTTKIPQLALDTANFDGLGNSSVAIGSAITVGTINFSGKSYTISLGAGGSLTLNNVGVDAQINDLSGTQTIAANMALASSSAGGVRLNVVNSTDNLNISGNITGIASGAGEQNLTKAGAGTVILTGTNTYGKTFILAGTLQVGNNTTTGNLGSDLVSDNGVLQFNRSDASVTIANSIGGIGVVQQSGSGTLVLSGANSYTGGTVVSSGVLQMGNVSALGTGLLNIVGSSEVDVNGLAATFGGITGTGVITNSAAANTTITINSGVNREFDGRIAETSGKGLLALVKTGGGELNMTNLNSYTGNTFITGGSIVLNPQGQASGTSIPGIINTSATGQVHLVDGLVANNVINMSGGAVDAVNFANSVTAAASATLTGAITATGTTVYQMGVASDFGTLTLTGTNTATANVANLSEGDIIFSGTGKLQVLTSGTTLGGAIRIGTGSNAVVSVINGASMSTTATTGDGLILGTGGVGDPNFQLPETLNITGGTVDIGTSTLNIQGSSFNTLVNNYVNSVVNLNTGGVLRLGAIREQIGSNSQLSNFNFNGGTLVATVSGRIFDSSTGDTLARVFSGGAIINVDQALLNNVLTPITATLGHSLINGSGTDGGLTKTGVGTLTLIQDNSYNGQTTVAAGDLILASSTSGPLGFSNAALTVASGARLDLNNQNLNNITSLNGGGGISQDSTGTVTLTFGNSNANGTFSGGVSNGSGKINMVKTGTGTQTFSGVNQYGSLTIASGAVLAAASGTLAQGTILVNSNNGLEIASGVSVSANIFTNVTGEFEDVPTGNGTISGPVTVQSGSYVVGLSGTGSLTLSNTQNLSGGTTATVDRGNVILASLAQFQATTATLTVGSPTFTTADSFTVRDSATLSVANIVLGGAAAQAISFNELGGTVNTNSGTFNLLSGGATGSTINLAGGNLTTTAFTKTSTAASTLNWNGGTITAAGSSTTFLPSLTGLAVNIGVGGAKFNDNGNTVTIGANLTGVSGDGGFNKSGTGNTTLSGNLNYTGATVVGAGTLTLTGTNDHIGTASGAGSLVIGAGATVVSSGLSTNSLTVSGHVQVASTAGQPAGTSKVNSLTVTASTGQLDIRNNALIVETTAAAKAATMSSLRALVTSGSNNNAWNGSGIVSTSLVDTSHYTVAVGDNASLNKSTFGGVAVDSNSVLVAAERYGDATMDGTVGDNDVAIVLANYGSTTQDWSKGNFLQTATVGDSDVALVLANYGFSGVSANLLPAVVSAPAIVGAPASVPEPSALALLGLGAVGLIRRRRR